MSKRQTTMLMFAGLTFFVTHGRPVATETPSLTVHHVWASPAFEARTPPCRACVLETGFPTMPTPPPTMRERDCSALRDGSGVEGRLFLI
jgi:hypothetical protein